MKRMWLNKYIEIRNKTVHPDPLPADGDKVTESPLNAPATEVIPVDGEPIDEIPSDETPGADAAWSNQIDKKKPGSEQIRAFVFLIAFFAAGEAQDQMYDPAYRYEDAEEH